MRIFKSTMNDMVGSYKQTGIHLVLDVLVTDCYCLPAFAGHFLESVKPLGKTHSCIYMIR